MNRKLNIFVFLLVFHLKALDVVIPAVPKDLPTLDLAIDGIRRNGKNVRRIFVVSREKLTNQAIWIDENTLPLPFSKEDLYRELIRPNENKRSKAWQKKKEKARNHTGWYLQQLLKIYAPHFIPQLSNPYLVMDSDTIFLRPVSFTDEEGRLLLNPGKKHFSPYFRHGKKLISGWKRATKHSGISHHMIFDQDIWNDIIMRAEKKHQKPFWNAFMNCVGKRGLTFSGASEYEIFTHHCFRFYPDRCRIRPLKWADVGDLDLEKYRREGYHYISSHGYLRERAQIKH